MRNIVIGYAAFVGFCVGWIAADAYAEAREKKRQKREVRKALDELVRIQKEAVAEAEDIIWSNYES